MSKIAGTNWQRNEDWHVPEDDLLPFVDGEQPAKVEAKIRKHLEACWTCRRRVEKVQQTISAYVEYYSEAYVDHVEPPPHGWRNFETSLRRVVAEAGRASRSFGWSSRSIGKLIWPAGDREGSRRVDSGGARLRGDSSPLPESTGFSQ